MREYYEILNDLIKEIFKVSNFDWYFLSKKEFKLCYLMHSEKFALLYKIVGLAFSNYFALSASERINMIEKTFNEFSVDKDFIFELVPEIQEFLNGEEIIIIIINNNNNNRFKIQKSTKNKKDA